MAPDSPRPLAKALTIASRQHGVISLAQARSAGLSKHAVGRLVRDGSWRRVRPTIYALWQPTQRMELWLQRLSAGTLSVGPGCAASHRAAAVLRALEGVSHAPVEVSTSKRGSARPGMVVHRVRSLAPNEVQILNGIPVTSTVRTILDLASVIGPRRLEMAIESAVRRRLATIEQLRTSVDRSSSTQRGRAVLRMLLDGYAPAPSDSALEVLLWGLLRDSGVPEPVRQHPVRKDGRVVARIDLAYPEARLAIEADGFVYHSSPRKWRSDRERQNFLVSLGWTVYRVTWEDVTQRSSRIVADIVQLLRRGSSTIGSR